MKMKLFTTIICSVFFTCLYGQDTNLKEKAIEEFKKENYPKAIQILKGALKESPKDADIYYYLGFLLITTPMTLDHLLDTILHILIQFSNIWIRLLN